MFTAEKACMEMDSKWPLHKDSDMLSRLLWAQMAQKMIARDGLYLTTKAMCPLDILGIEGVWQIEKFVNNWVGEKVKISLSGILLIKIRKDLIFFSED